MSDRASRRFVHAALGGLMAGVAHIAGAAETAPAPNADDCDRCGKVETIRQVTVRDQWTPLGSTSTSASADGGPSSTAVYQIGKGFTNQGQVLLGAAGGGTYRTKPNELNATRWEVVVRMDAGGNRTVAQNYEPMLREGDRVRVFGKQIELLQ